MNLSNCYLLDQMFDRHVLAELRGQGFDVVSVSEIGISTADDAEIMQWDIEHDRIVITLDEHFGDWSVLPLTNNPGVIRLKINPATTEYTLSLLAFLKHHSDNDFSKYLVIVRPTGIRWIKTV